MWSDPLPDGFVYSMPPIDWWTGWTNLDNASEAEAYGFEGEEAAVARTRQRLEQIIEHAKSQFRSRGGWEGDVRQGPFIGGLPPTEGNADGDVMVGLKQDNNGTVFIWSPYQLSWLNEYAR